MRDDPPLNRMGTLVSLTKTELKYPREVLEVKFASAAMKKVSPMMELVGGYTGLICVVIFSCTSAVEVNA